VTRPLETALHHAPKQRRYESLGDDRDAHCHRYQGRISRPAGLT
jgi:hypothetical protein